MCNEPVESKKLLVRKCQMRVVIRLPRNDRVHTRVTVWASPEAHQRIGEVIPSLRHGVPLVGFIGPSMTYLHDPRYDLNDTVECLREQEPNVIVEHLVFPASQEGWLEKWQ